MSDIEQVLERVGDRMAKLNDAAIRLSKFAVIADGSPMGQALAAMDGLDADYVALAAAYRDLEAEVRALREVEKAALGFRNEQERARRDSNMPLPTDWSPEIDVGTKREILDAALERVAALREEAPNE